MSFEINWDNLIADGLLNRQIKAFLDNQFKSLSLPSFVNDLYVEDFSLGTIPPDITIRHIGDPFPDFYEADCASETSEQENEQHQEEEKQNPEGQRYRTNTFSKQGENMVPVDTGEDLAEYQKELLHSATSRNDISSISEEQDNVSPIAKNNASPNFKRSDSESISLLIGPNNLNYSQNFNMNNVGIGYLNHEPSNYNGISSPKAFLSHNRLNSTTTSSPPAPSKIKNSKPASENDVQLIAEINYKGDLRIELSVSLLLNYPSPNFISLPIKLEITDLEIHSIATIAYLDKNIYFSFLCDIDDSNADYFASASSATSGTSSGGNIVDYLTSSNRERIDIIKSIRIESEIGEAENNVLRNVGKVEKFLVEQLRSIIRDELAWPGWICFDLSPEEEENSTDDE